MKSVTIVLSIVVLCVLLCGCSIWPGKSNNSSLAGGTTNKTDENAPKHIESKEIISFFTQFYAYDKYDRDSGSLYIISVEDNEEGELTFKINGRYIHEMPVDAQVMADIQNIIDEQNMVQRNGIYKRTAGLPPQWTAWTLNAIYASGEKLTYTENGAPEAAWTTAFRDYFTELLVEAGFEDAMVPKEAITIDRYDFEFNNDGVRHSYGIMLAPDENKKYAWHGMRDSSDPKKMYDEYAELTDELFEGLQKVIEAYDIEGFTCTVLAPYVPASGQDEESFVDLYVQYQSGRRIFCKYKGSEIPERWPEIRDAIKEYFDAYNSEHLVKKGTM